MKITTNYERKIGPSRNYDWSAVDDDTYDYDSPIGYGPTEQEAIDDLMEQLADCAVPYSPLTSDPLTFPCHDCDAAALASCVDIVGHGMQGYHYSRLNQARLALEANGVTK